MKNLLKELRDHHHTWLDTVILIVIILSAVLIGVETDVELVHEYGWLFHIIDLAILWIFVCEFAIKLIAHGSQPWKYFTSPWNLFDFVIVVIGFAPIVIHFMHPDSTTDYHAVAALRLIRLARAIRVMRVFRLITHLRELQVLVETLVSSFKRLLYVGLLLVCLFYVYAVVGVFLFRDNDPGHFQNLQQAHMTLFQCITGDGWSDLMNNEIRPSPEHLGEHFEAYPFLSPLYFGSFIVIGSYVLLNLVVGIIISAMEKANEEHEVALEKEILAAQKLQSQVLDDILDRLQRMEKGKEG